MKEKRKPGFGAAMLPILVMAFVLGIGFGKFRLSVEVLLLVCSFFTVLLGLFYGTTWNEIADAVSEKIGKSFMAIFIFVFVGMIIGTWMLSGTIPMLIYYGLKLLNPQLFLISAFVITVIVSVCTGTSFGSVGTVGLALIGVAQGLGVNLPAAAGAIISGAYFGDKMSPLSDTTNLAPVAAGTTLFEHIRHMFYTTVPAALVCLVVYFIAGRTGMVVSSVDASAANEMTEGLASIYHFNVIISAAYSGFSLSMLGIDPETVTGSIKTLVERGGMTSMMATVLKVLCAFLFAGAMSAAGFMNAILEKLKTFVHSDGTLILVTVISVLIIALIVGNAYIPILMGGELFSESFKERNLAPQNLSRTLEDAGTCSIPLVPWSAGGAYMSGTLGVSTFAYAPWAIFCYAGFCFAVLWGFTGFGIKKLNKDK